MDGAHHSAASVNCVTNCAHHNGGCSCIQAWHTSRSHFNNTFSAPVPLCSTANDQAGALGKLRFPEDELQM